MSGLTVTNRAGRIVARCDCGQSEVSIGAQLDDDAPKAVWILLAFALGFAVGAAVVLLR